MSKDKLYILKQELKSEEQRIEFARKSIWIMLDKVKELEEQIRELEFKNVEQN